MAALLQPFLCRISVPNNIDRDMHPFLSRSFCALATTASLIALPTLGAELDPQPIKPELQRLIDQMYPGMRSVYEDLHANPELGFQETRTAVKLATEMRKLGFEVTEGIGKTGLVAIYRNGTGPTVMVRTELDALNRPALCQQSEGPVQRQGELCRP